jgi:hypothetical protein
VGAAVYCGGPGGCEKKLKKILPSSFTLLFYALLFAPYGRKDSMFARPITGSRRGTGLMACQLLKVAEKNFSYYAR